MLNVRGYRVFNSVSLFSAVGVLYKIVQDGELAPWTIAAQQDRLAGAEHRRVDRALCVLSLARSTR